MHKVWEKIAEETERWMKERKIILNLCLLTGTLGIIRRYGDRRKGEIGGAVLYPEGLWWDAIVDREDFDWWIR